VATRKRSGLVTETSNSGQEFVAGFRDSRSRLFLLTDLFVSRLLAGFQQLGVLVCDDLVGVPQSADASVKASIASQRWPMRAALFMPVGTRFRVVKGQAEIDDFMAVVRFLMGQPHSSSQCHASGVDEICGTVYLARGA
jgi:hypothetical protein